MSRKFVTFFSVLSDPSQPPSSNLRFVRLWWIKIKFGFQLWLEIIKVFQTNLFLLQLVSIFIQKKLMAVCVSGCVSTTEEAIQRERKRDKKCCRHQSDGPIPFAEISNKIHLISCVQLILGHRLIHKMASKQIVTLACVCSSRNCESFFIVT